MTEQLGSRPANAADPPRWAPDIRIVAALFVLPLLVLLPAALLRGVFYIHDLQYYFYPYHVMPGDLLRRGELPLWNPYAFAGMPLIGDGQTALFYPPNWLFFVLPGAAALNYAVLCQFGIAGAGMYLFGRNLGAGRLPAIIGALAFMFSGFLTARVVHLSIQSGAALIPLVFLCVDRAFRVSADVAGRARSFVFGRPRWLAAAAGAVGLQAVSGHPQVPVYTALALGLYAMFHGVARWRAQSDPRWLYRCLFRLAAIYGLGYALAAIQLAPWIELGRFSPRAAGADFEMVLGSSMTVADWLLMLFPYLNGSLAPAMYSSAPLPILLMVRTWEHSGYVGLLPLALAAYALSGTFTRGNLNTRFFGLLLIAAALFATGKYTPVGDVIYRLPVIGKLRAVERAMALVDFALASLAVLGVQRWMAFSVARRGDGARLSTSSRPRAELLVMGAALLLLLPVVVVLGQGWAVRRAWHLSPEAIANLQFARPNVAIPLLFALLSAALLGWWSRRTPTSRTLGLAAALVLLDVGCYAAMFNPLGESKLYTRQPGVIGVLPGRDEPFRKATVIESNDLPTRAARESLAVSWSMVYGVEDINGFNSLQSRRYTDYLFGPQVGDVSYGLLNRPALLRKESPILNALNVRYVLVAPGMAPPADASFRQVFENRDVRVFENLSAYPRAFFAETVRRETDPQQILAAVTADGFDGRRLALLETDGPPPLGPDQPAGRATAAITGRGANRITLITETDAPRLLVLSEMYYPGWRATIDGAETPIYRTNYLFRGIVVPAGRHEVVFAYRPASLMIGATISIVALAICGVMLRPRRRD